MSKRAKTKPEEKILIGLFYTPYLALNSKIYKGLEEAGFTDLRPAQFSVFQHIEPEGSRATEMAERAQITKQSMGYLVEMLEKQGYVQQVPDPTDGRARLVRLTDRGHAVNQVAEEVLQQAETEWAKKLGKNKMQKLRNMLSNLVTEINS
ncbi:MAG: MarR family transcriptional regulator [Chloroflexi bacterium]|nr:MarR family transcriptional regulator [Chloroflexota bacterium]OJV86803.1 MAG: MarR family transcriptional regulator [Chloroflexi bacterium 54-19]